MKVLRVQQRYNSLRDAAFLGEIVGVLKTRYGEYVVKQLLRCGISIQMKGDFWAFNRIGRADYSFSLAGAGNQVYEIPLSGDREIDIPTSIVFFYRYFEGISPLSGVHPANIMLVHPEL